VLYRVRIGAASDGIGGGEIMADTTLNVLDGAGVIGGTKILLQSPKARVFLDFGTNFAHWNSYFEEYLKPRASRGLLDPAELGLLPPLPNIYRPDFMPPGIDPWAGIEIPGFAKGDIDAVLLTHAHLDHCGYLSYLRLEVPVLASLVTAFLMKAIQESSKGDFEKEICYCVPREEKNGVLKTVDYRKGPGKQRTFLTSEKLALPAEAISFWTNTIGSRALVPQMIAQVGAIKDIKVHSLAVDHSIPGCVAFVLETESGAIAYTGDLRLHGAQGKLTADFAKAAASFKPQVLICEGTRVGRDVEEMVTEGDVRETAAKAIRAAKGLVIADFGSRNLERLSTFREIAADCGRQLVLMTKDIHLLRANFVASGAGIDPATDPVILLFEEEKAAESSADKTIYETYAKKLVGTSQISKDQGKFIVCFSYWDVNELILIKPVPGSIYIYSSSEAYDEEQRADMQRLRNWLVHLGITPLGVPDPATGKPLAGETRFHASGHAAPDDLLEIVRIINPKTLVPVHTENPRFFVDHCSKERKVHVPETGVPFAI
jgi:ribonuclease J